MQPGKRTTRSGSGSVWDIPGARGSISFAAARRYHASSIGVAGGVSANSRLRKELKAHGEAREVPTVVPSLQLSTDNAAMIAAAGLRKFRAGITSPLDLNADASLAL